MATTSWAEPRHPGPRDRARTITQTELWGSRHIWVAAGPDPQQDPHPHCCQEAGMAILLRAVPSVGISAVVLGDTADQGGKAWSLSCSQTSLGARHCTPTPPMAKCSERARKGHPKGVGGGGWDQRAGSREPGGHRQSLVPRTHSAAGQRGLRPLPRTAAQAPAHWALAGPGRGPARCAWEGQGPGRLQKGRL